MFTKHALKKSLAILSLPLAFLCVAPIAEAKQVTVEATGQCRYDANRAMASFPIKRYNEKGFYTIGSHMIRTTNDLFYYDYTSGRIGVWEDKINYDDPLLFNENIIAACKQAKSVCVMDGRKASIWEQ